MPPPAADCSGRPPRRPRPALNRSSAYRRQRRPAPSPSCGPWLRTPGGGGPRPPPQNHRPLSGRLAPALALAVRADAHAATSRPPPASCRSGAHTARRAAALREVACPGPQRASVVLVRPGSGPSSSSSRRLAHAAPARIAEHALEIRSQRRCCSGSSRSSPAGCRCTVSRPAKKCTGVANQKCRPAACGSSPAAADRRPRHPPPRRRAPRRSSQPRQPARPAPMCPATASAPAPAAAAAAARRRTGPEQENPGGAGRDGTR